jgi:hypothetical protein
MNDKTRKSRLGFAVIKLLIDGDSYFVMRKNLTWRDVSFVGGGSGAEDFQISRACTLNRERHAWSDLL